MVGAVIKELISRAREALTITGVASQAGVNSWQALPLSAVVPEARSTLVVAVVCVC